MNAPDILGILFSVAELEQAVELRFVSRKALSACPYMADLVSNSTHVPMTHWGYPPNDNVIWDIMSMVKLGVDSFIRDGTSYTIRGKSPVPLLVTNYRCSRKHGVEINRLNRFESRWGVLVYEHDALLWYNTSRWRGFYDYYRDSQTS